MIPLVTNTSDLEWYVDDTWSKVDFEPKDQKKAIMDWLLEETEDEVVLASIPSYQIYSPPGSAYSSMINSAPSATAYFRDVGEAMMFKLAWG